MRRPLALLAVVLLLPLPGTTFALDVDVSDLDGDGLANLQEDVNDNSIVDTGETSPLRADSDGGGESDGSEVRYGRNPLKGDDDFSADPDGDGLPNGLEMQRGTNPQVSDTDGDGVSDKDDPFPLEKAFRTDIDHDGIADEWERANGFMPTTAADADLDADSDGVSNREEFVSDTDPRDTDTDRDGVPDGQEVQAGTDPDESLCLIYTTEGQTAFADITGHFAESGIRQLSGVRAAASQMAIIGGYQDGIDRVYLPNREVTRLEFLKMALLSSCIALREATVGEALPFADMTEVLAADASSDEILRQRLVKTGVLHSIIRGYEADNGFHPDMPVARAEALKMLLNASRLDQVSVSASGATVFSDVPADAWYVDVVRQGAALGIIEGYGDGTIRPTQSITRGEAALIILRAIRTNPGVNGEVLPAA